MSEEHPDILGIVNELGKQFNIPVRVHIDPTTFEGLKQYMWDPNKSPSGRMVVANPLPFQTLRPYAKADAEMTAKIYEEMHVDTKTAALAEIAKQIEENAKQIELERLTALYEEFGGDEYPEETVFRFTKRFSEGGQEYTYVALKTAGKWSLSGKFQVGIRYMWSDLVLFLLGKGVETPFDELARMYTFDEAAKLLNDKE